jgi:glycosyltransferase involved in cell wall biosynthesis
MAECYDFKAAGQNINIVKAMEESLNYSIVVPLHNEEENVAELVAEIEAAMAILQKPWELICVDDGSSDRTKSIILKLAQTVPQLRLIAFDRNYGQSSAFDAGFKAAKGEFVITLDGDRQNDPLDIPAMVAIAGDVDLVCGKRAKRRDTWVKRITSRLANAVRSRFCKDGVSDTGCSLKVYRREALQRIKMYNGMHRFLPALFMIEGFRVAEVPVNHRPRVKGSTKYNFFNRSLNTVFDMFAVRWMYQRHLCYRIDREDS